MVKRYKKFLESKIGLENLISVSNDLTDLFIELDDKYGFDIETEIIFDDKEYDQGGKFIREKESRNDEVIIRGIIKDVNLEIVDNTRIFIENIISRNGREFHVSKIIGNKVKNIYGRFRYGQIGYTWEDYDIDLNNHWKDWLGRFLTSAIKLNRKYNLDGEYNISFEVHFEI